MAEHTQITYEETELEEMVHAMQVSTCMGWLQDQDIQAPEIGQWRWQPSHETALV